MGSSYDKDKYLGRVQGKTDVKVGTSGSSGFEEGGAGNAISASYFFGDGSGLTGISGGGGGGGSTYQFWDPMAPPSSANSLDDEFTSALSGWQTWNPDSISLTTEINNGRLFLINATTGGGDANCGIYRQAPTASSGDYEYTFWTHMSWLSEDQTNFPISHIFIAEDIDTNPSTAKIWTMGIIKEGNYFRAAAQLWSDYNSWNGVNQEALHQPSAYLRIRASYNSGTNTTTKNFEYSVDGVGWSNVITRTYTGHLPYIGIGCNNVGGSARLYGIYSFFRVYADNNFYYFPSGSYAERTLA